MNDDLISRKAAIDAICDNCDTVEASCPHYPCGRYVAVEKLPSAQPEHMHTVMLKIKEKYEKAMNTPCINNPIAWALYQTWKEYDR